MLGKIIIDKNYIKRHFRDILGDDIKLLDQKNGLIKLKRKIRHKLSQF